MFQPMFPKLPIGLYSPSATNPYNLYYRSMVFLTALLKVQYGLIYAFHIEYDVGNSMVSELY